MASSFEMKKKKRLSAYLDPDVMNALADYAARRDVSLSLVAEADGLAIGHVLFSRVSVNGEAGSQHGCAGAARRPCAHRHLHVPAAVLPEAARSLTAMAKKAATPTLSMPAKPHWTFRPCDTSA
jgi:hypothetical protein